MEKKLIKEDLKNECDSGKKHTNDKNDKELMYATEETHRIERDQTKALEERKKNQPKNETVNGATVINEATENLPDGIELMDTTDADENPRSDKDKSEPGRDKRKTEPESVRSVDEQWFIRYGQTFSNEATTEKDPHSNTESMDTTGDQPGAYRNISEAGQGRRRQQPESVLSVDAKAKETKSENLMLFNTTRSVDAQGFTRGGQTFSNEATTVKDPHSNTESMDTTGDQPGSYRNISKAGQERRTQQPESQRSVDAQTKETMSENLMLLKTTRSVDAHGFTRCNQTFSNEATTEKDPQSNTESMDTTGDQPGSYRNISEAGQERRTQKPKSQRSVDAQTITPKAMGKKSENQRLFNTTHGGYSSANSVSPVEESTEHLMAMKTLQRTKEASKQMLYDVFCNFITILEEFERRELESWGLPTTIASSNIPSPSHKHKSFKTVESIVKAQLFMVENQTVVCPPEVLAEVTEDLRIRIIKWAAVRTDNKIHDMHQTDYYISKLYEILVKGSIDHHFPQRFDVSQESMKEGFTKLLAGAHATDKLDERFKANRDTNAVRPDTRCGESFEDVRKKIRLSCNNQTINKCLDKDLKTIEEENIR